MSTILAGHGLTRRFGTLTAVRDVDISVESGEIVGLLGANGAGKTTLIRLLLGLLAPNVGDVELLGRPRTRASRRHVGYVPQHLGLYADLSVASNRDFRRAVHGRPRGVARDGEDEVLVGNLPLGSQRRLAFDLAIEHEPRLLVLDEPTSGVGPLGRARLWERIGDVATPGRGVLVTTHHLAEAEQCDRLVIMAGGRVVSQGTLTEVIGPALAVQITGAAVAPVLAALDQARIVAALSMGGVTVPGADTDAVVSALDEAGVHGAVVRTRPATLEERFVELATSDLSTSGQP